MAKAKYVEGDIIVKDSNKTFRRLILNVIPDYIGNKGQFGYKYQDMDFPNSFFNQCSENTMYKWRTRN